MERFRCTLNDEFESDLVGHIIDMQTRVFGMSTEQVRKLAFNLADQNHVPNDFSKENRMPGYDWMDDFLLRRNPELSLRQPEATSLCGATAFNKVQFKKFFDLLRDVMTKHKFSSSRIYNVDESGFSTV